MIVALLAGCSIAEKATSEVSCEDQSGAGQAPAGPACRSGTISCGETVKGHNAGGTRAYDDKFYQAFQCLTQTEGYAGEERIYELQLAADTIADVKLDSPCEDLDLIVFSWPDDDCPTAAHSTSQCDASIEPGSDKLRLVTDRNKKRYLISVEGKQGVTAPFELSVRCTSRGS